MNDTLKHVNNIRNWLQEKTLDALIIPHADEYLSEYLPPQNERLKWATGFSGSAGLAVITDTKGAIFVDGRYTIQLKEQEPIKATPCVSSSVEVLITPAQCH